jgi:hypothetical protein
MAAKKANQKERSWFDAHSRHHLTEARVKRKRDSTSQNRDQPPPVRQNRETPRASTIPAYPKQRIDD